MNTSYLQFLLSVVFISIIFLHISKKNSEAVMAYVIQSLAIAGILLDSFLQTRELSLLFVVILIIVIKAILAPIFFMRLINKHKLAFTVSSYLSVPMTLIGITLLTFVAHSHKLNPLTTIIPENHTFLALALSSMLLSLFLIVNRKGALSQIIGVLSLEGSIITFIVFAGLEQSSGLQAGVAFNIFLWIIISTVFAAMIYKQFGSLNVTSMKNLTD